MGAEVSYEGGQETPVITEKLIQNVATKLEDDELAAMMSFTNKLYNLENEVNNLHSELEDVESELEASENVKHALIERLQNVEKKLYQSQTEQDHKQQQYEIQLRNMEKKLYITQQERDYCKEQNEQLKRAIVEQKKQNNTKINLKRRSSREELILR